MQDREIAKDRICYKMAEIPKVTGLSIALAYRDAKDGKLKTRKMGGTTLVFREDLLAWLNGAANAA